MTAVDVGLFGGLTCPDIGNLLELLDFGLLLSEFFIELSKFFLFNFDLIEELTFHIC
jgi:hypothetical protein